MFIGYSLFRLTLHEAAVEAVSTWKGEISPLAPSYFAKVSLGILNPKGKLKI
jgi:hypothetical protein